MEILSALISSQKNSIQKVYDPFIGEASSLLKLSHDCELGFQRCYGKEANKLKYSYTIVRLFLHNFDFNSMFINNTNALESIDINQTSFDAIISQIPNINNVFVKNQSLELLRRIKRNELEEILLENFEIDSKSFNYDDELNNALENIVNQINFDNAKNVEFEKEYESLNESEYLFLINLVESLKYDGIMAVSISDIFTVNDSLKTLRKYLTEEKNYIDTIINLQNKNEDIIVFCKNKTDNNILFIDIDEIFDINKICDVFLQKRDIGEFSHLASLDEVRKNDFNLQASKYINNAYINIDELFKQKKQIDSNQDKLNSKIKKLMDELNINI